MALGLPKLLGSPGDLGGGIYLRSILENPPTPSGVPWRVRAILVPPPFPPPKAPGIRKILRRRGGRGGEVCVCVCVHNWSGRLGPDFQALRSNRPFWLWGRR